MLFSQTWKVIDCATKSEIPYYTIFDSTQTKSIGIGNKKGEFVLNAKFINQNVWIHCLGYEPKKIFIKDIQEKTICMDPKVVLLEEVSVLADKKERTDNFRWKPLKNFSYVQPADDGLSVQRGNLYFFDAKVLLSAVSIFTGKDSKLGSVFRVRVYQVFRNDAYLLDSVVEIGSVQLLAHVNCKNCWQKIPIDYPLLAEGNILVAVEWLPSDVSKTDSFSSVVKGLILGASVNNEVSPYSSINNGAWKRTLSNTNNVLDKKIVPMIRVFYKIY
jgi:hypothetical protein